MRLSAFATLLAFACCSCGSDFYGQWEGTYVGTQSGTSFDIEFSLQLWENDDGSLRGYAMGLYDDGRTFGVMDVEARKKSGGGLELTLEQGSRCAGTLTADLDANGDELAGQITGNLTDQCGTTVDCAALNDPPDLPLSIACGALSATLQLEQTR